MSSCNHPRWTMELRACPDCGTTILRQQLSDIVAWAVVVAFAVIILASLVRVLF